MINGKRIFLLLSACLLCLSAQAGELILKNAHAELRFDDGKQFVFKSFRMEGKELLPAGGSRVHPWEITLLGPKGETPALQPRWAWYDGGVLEGDTAVFSWRLFLNGRDNWPLRVKVTLGADAELPQWSIEAQLPEGWVVTTLDFPRITLSQPTGGKAVLPVGYGTEYNLGGTLRSDYPSCTGSMQMVLVHNAEGCLYYAAEDPDANRKSFVVASDGQGVTLSQPIIASYAWTAPDGHFALPWHTVLGYRAEDWTRTALHWYRPFALSTQWGARNVKDRKIVSWVEHADMWLRPGDVSEKTMNALRQALDLYGPGTGLHWYYWHKYPFDTNYPDYLPAQQGFADMVREARSLGAYVTPYINGRLWDPANETYDRYNGAAASCRKTDGSLYTEVYGSKAVNTVTCPASPIWQERMKAVCGDILRDLKTDGVYIDQIGAAIGEPCYADHHPHPKGAGAWWPAAYRRMLNDMRAELFTRKQALTTEENAECYIDLFDMLLVVNSPHNAWTRMVPLFPLIYSDRCVYSGYTYIPDDLGHHVMDFISMKSLLWGSQLGWVAPTILMNFPQQARFLKNLTDFRKSAHDLFFGGRFLGELVPGGDNPQVEVPGYERTPVVMGATWADARGRQAVVLVNMDGAAHTVSLPDGRTVEVPGYNAVRL